MLTRTEDPTLLGLTAFRIRSVIDVGANTGQFARVALARWPDAHVYSFEPLPVPFDRLRRWAHTQGGRVTALNIALGDHNGSVKMHELESNDLSSVLRPTQRLGSLFPGAAESHEVQVQVRRLDDWSASTEGLEQEILVKIDVQGYEDRVIRGGYNTISIARACIVEIGFDSLYEGQGSFNEIYETLRRSSLRYAGNLFQGRAMDGRVTWIDAVFVRS